MTLLTEMPKAPLLDSKGARLIDQWCTGAMQAQQAPQLGASSIIISSMILAALVVVHASSTCQGLILVLQLSLRPGNVAVMTRLDLASSSCCYI